MLDISYYYNYSTETISYYYRQLKNKEMFFIINIYNPQEIIYFKYLIMFIYSLFLYL